MQEMSRFGVVNFINCPVILGSATPALESFARAKKGVYTLLTLQKRAMKQSLTNCSYCRYA